MKLSRKTISMVGMATLGLAVGQAAQPTYAQTFDGSFGTVSGTSSYTTIGTSGKIGQWTVTSGSVDLINTYWSPSVTGTKSTDMSGSMAGTISQTFSTIAGQNYVFTFDLAGNPDGGPTVKTLFVSAPNTTTHTAYTFDTTGHTKASMGWTPEVFQFTATASTSTLTFASQDNTPFGPAVDNINLVPEPSSVAAFAFTGVGALGLMLKARKRKGVTA